VVVVVMVVRNRLSAAGKESTTERVTVDAVMDPRLLALALLLRCCCLCALLLWLLCLLLFVLLLWRDDGATSPRGQTTRKQQGAL